MWLRWFRSGFLGVKQKPLRLRWLAANLFAWVFGLGACTSSQNTQPEDTPTSGHIRIAIDIALKPATDALLEQFHRTYPKARIDVVYTNEAEAVAGLLADSFRVVIVPRPFTPADSAALAEQRIRPKQTRLVREGIAVIGHPSRRDSLLSLDTLIAWLRNPRSPYTFVVEGGSGSATYRYLRDSLLGEPPQAPLYRVDSAPEAIAYVQQNPRAIGLIGVAWVCDREDSTTQKFLRSVRLFALAPSGEKGYYFPYAGYLRPGFYPLARDVYALSREPRLGLGSGFISYAAGPEGQRILLKSELLPAIAPVRVVEIREEPLPIPTPEGR